MTRMEQLRAELEVATKAADAAQLSAVDAQELELRRKIDAQREREKQAAEDALTLRTEQLLEEAKTRYPTQRIGAVHVEGAGDGVFIVRSPSKASYDSIMKRVEEKKATPTDTRNFALANLLYPDPAQNDVHAMFDAHARLADTLANEALALGGERDDRRSKRR